FLGVCVGMQLLADEGHEHGVHDGLGWIGGAVDPLERGAGVPIPHTGWNDVEIVRDAAAGTPFDDVRDGEAFYFNHGYCFVPDDPSVVAAVTTHGRRVVAAIARGNILATQFHPEKSQRAGLDILARFVEWTPPVDAA